jgi:hypothetical protein
MLVNVPAAPFVVATEMPVADAEPIPMVVAAAVVSATAPQPMMMGSVVSATAPQPMMMSSGAGYKFFSLKCDSGGGCQDNTPPSDVPPALRTKGVTSAEWAAVKCHLEEHMAGNGWKNCALVEPACVCTCWCACVGCIPFNMIGNYAARHKAMKERRIPEINAMLNPHGIWAEFTNGMGGEFLMFYAR